jgi:hypothetical protein
MPLKEPLPQVFATITQQLSRDVAFKFLRSSIGSDGQCRVEKISEILTYGMSDLQFHDLDSFEAQPYLVDVPNHPNTSWWKMPMYYLIDNVTVPVIEFQYKAWLPTNDFVTTVDDRFVSESLSQIYRRVNSDIRDQMRQPQMVTRPQVLQPQVTQPQVAQPQVRQPSPTPSQARPLPLPQNIGSLIIQAQRDTDEACPITASPYRDLQHLTVTSCFHVFDTESIKKWCKTHSTCPVCRTTITNLVSA